jgi:hypothetical protein
MCIQQGCSQAKCIFSGRSQLYCSPEKPINHSSRKRPYEKEVNILEQ